MEGSYGSNIKSSIKGLLQGGRDEGSGGGSGGGRGGGGAGIFSTSRQSLLGRRTTANNNASDGTPQSESTLPKRPVQPIRGPMGTRQRRYNMYPKRKSVIMEEDKESMNGEEEATKIPTTAPPSGSTTTTVPTTRRPSPRARRATSVQEDRASPGREAGITKQKSAEEQQANREVEVATDATQTSPLQGSEANKDPPKAYEDPPKPPEKELGPLTEKEKNECEKEEKEKDEREDEDRRVAA